MLLQKYIAMIIFIEYTQPGTFSTITKHHSSIWELCQVFFSKYQAPIPVHRESAFIQ